MEIMRKYQPSNGSEGDWFTDKFCFQCQECNPNPNGKKQCDILMRTLIHNVGDDEYPTEWIYDENDNPMCAAHKPWNWEEMGNPDDEENENYVMPYNPNQIELF